MIREKIWDEGEEVFSRLKGILAAGGLTFVVHEHEPTRTVREAEHNLSFDVQRIVKTVVFRIKEMNMKAAFGVALAILAVSALQTPGYAVEMGSMTCDGGIISRGNTAEDVLRKCGQPSFATQKEEKIVEEVGNDFRDYRAAIVRTVLVDDWTFNFGPDRFQYRVLLKNGRVTRIESLDYGY